MRNLIKKILFAAPHSFSGDIRVGAQNYAVCFADKNWDVGYLSSVLSFFKIMKHKNRKLISEQFDIYRRGGVFVKKNLWTYVPLTLMPHHNHTFLDRKFFLDNYYRFTLPSIEKKLKKVALNEVELLWLDCPHQNYLRKIVKYKHIIYRVADNLKFFKDIGPVVLRGHDEALEMADVILVSSKLLEQEIRKEFPNRKIAYCPNGVYLDNFIRDDYKVPIEYRDMVGEKALYVGSIEEWFDVELLDYLALKSPKINFIIIGFDKNNILSITKRRNITYLGPKKYEDIPNYIKYCDFCFIPFKSSDLIRTVNPIKIYEYFSLGKPVVSTSWDELELLAAPCHLAKNRNEFLEIINDYRKLKLYSSEQLITYAKQNTWEKRIDTILKILSDINYEG